MATAKACEESQFSYSSESDDLYDMVCQPCNLDGKLQEAVGLCNDCQECLCQRCFDVHTLPTPTRNHKLLDKMVQQQVSLKKDNNCSEKCTVHAEKYIKYYCKNHYQLGCSVCITIDHRSCDNVRYIPLIAKDLEINEEYKQLENQLESAINRSKKLTEECERTTESIEKSCSDAVETVKESRKVIKEALDRTETDMVHNCETQKAEELENLAHSHEKCKTARIELEILQTMKDTHQNNKQNCNLYIAMMKAKDKLTLADESLREAEKEYSSINTQINFVPNKRNLSKMKSAESFGKVSKSGVSSCFTQEQTRTTIKQPETPAVVKKSENKTAVKQEDTRNAEKKSEPRKIVRAQHVQNINVKSRKDKKTCNITGLVVLPDNRLLVTDYSSLFSGGNENIKFVNIKTGEVINHLTLLSNPWNAAMVTNNQVAVTLPWAKNVVIVNVPGTTMTVDRTLNVNGVCLGLDFKDGKLAVTFSNPFKVQVLTLDGKVMYNITNDDQDHALFNDPRYVIFGHDNASLYVSNSESDSVVHVKLDGTVLSRYTDSELRVPRGLLTDRSGNVYVCEEGSGNIHQITRYCKKIQLLLTGADGLNCPNCISYSVAEDRLYVAQWNNNVVKEYRVTLGSK